MPFGFELGGSFATHSKSAKPQTGVVRRTIPPPRPPGSIAIRLDALLDLSRPLEVGLRGEEEEDCRMPRPHPHCAVHKGAPAAQTI
jgi:hypothetical protein